MPVDKLNRQSITVPEDIREEVIKGFYVELSSLLTTSPEEVAVDTSAWKSITSSHIHVLWHAYQRCTENGVRMHLISPSTGLIRVLRVLDLYDLITGGVDDSPNNTKETVRLSTGPGVHKYVDDFGVDLESIDQALKQFMNFLKEFGVSEIIKAELQLLFYEVATNIKCHSRMMRDARVVFCAVTEKTKLIMTFADSGRPYNPNASTADIDVITSGRNRKTRGFGIMMIRKLANRITYVRKFDNMNILTLEKKWDASK